MEYILRIKDEIEKALEPVITDHAPRVFLDAEALQLGDHWHSKIMESLNQCKAIVCLVSEGYLKSEYCTRERLWWNARQTRDGHFLDGPYPVYFVKLEEGLFSERREVKEMMAVLTDPLPWFEVKKKLQEEFIRERLNSISAAVCDKVRAAGLARGSFCSALPPLYENFVGRITELRELHELCVSGKYPVIQAFGGVGKTELSVAYAYGFADQYPMGRFLFRMERVTSWDEAFAKALGMDGTDAACRLKKVSEELGIDDELLREKDFGKLHRAAAEAFLDRAAKGPLLILLDNLDEQTSLLKPSKMRDFLCGSPIPQNLRILATTRGTFRFSDREKFHSYELKNLKEAEAFEMVCLTGNGMYPFDKEPPSTENKEYQAAKEVIRFLDGHAWSMEIISAFMADNYDPEGFTFAIELESLRKNSILSSDFGTYRAGEDSATSDELLRPTLDRLAKLELGAATLELAVFAACFDPDEIPLYLLKEYWDRNFPDTVCSENIAPSSYAVNLLAKYHLLREGGETCKMHRLVQAVFLARKEQYLSHIIETLPKCSFVPAKFWVPILLQSPELIDVCPQDGTLTGKDWAKLLVDPAFAEKCPWPTFDGRDWVEILREQPQFADRCDWNKLDGGNWKDLLAARTRFSDKCDWSKLNGTVWARLLAEHPEYADRCDWSKLEGSDWAELLEDQPHFASRCDWAELDGLDWAWLLADCPQFADKCDWSKLDGWAWETLLARQPQFADKCDWSKLDGGNWSGLLADCPQFADKCSWSKLTGRDWSVLLARQPQFADRCCWSRLEGRDWGDLLVKQPQFADRCDWRKLDGCGWARLLGEHPEFADRCEWSTLGGRDWVDLLGEQPQFGKYCDWNSLGGWDWRRLLEKHPEWHAKLVFSRLSAENTAILLGGIPQFAERCDLSKLQGEDWAALLVEQPCFADCCNWNELDGKDWLRLLTKRPQFADRCDWDKLDGGNWGDLLVEQPQFAEHCAWRKLGGLDWSWVLRKRPQFADRCDWDKLDGEHWALLLEDQPQFADKCDLSNLSEEDRRMLLEKFPQLQG